MKKVLIFVLMQKNKKWYYAQSLTILCYYNVPWIGDLPQSFMMLKNVNFVKSSKKSDQL